MKFLILFLVIILSQVLSAIEVNKLIVSGSATLYKPADHFNLMMGVETYAPDVKTATHNNTIKMQSVIAALLKTGLAENEIQTKNFTLIPQLTPSPKDLPENWQPSIVGYQVRNTLEIRTNKIDLIGEVIEAAANVGVNLIESISFSLEDEESAKLEAIDKAFRQAELYAKAAVTSAGINLNEILELSINAPYSNPLFAKFNTMASKTTPPISPREVEVTAVISVTYAISSKKLYN